MSDTFDKPVSEISATELLKRIQWYATNDGYKSYPDFTLRLIGDVCEEWFNANPPGSEKST